ncbi:hypothetical protein [Niabella aurantiaca]|uniref:hypothetical protein n=1 Tax=Niabella aurantiaca TaxID=379900 RepID=UPI00037E8AE2|nr:hypothetical protein [Niabella aurantiaca]
MGNNIYLLLTFAVLPLIFSCKKSIEKVDFSPEVTILFQGVGDSNIVYQGMGVSEYTAKIDVQSTGTGISNFEIYTADTRTGAKGALIDGTARFFENAVRNYSTSYTVPDLVDNKCIKVVVTDTLGRVYEKNLFVRITPVVIFTQPVRMETVENYYGPYFATWLSGRVYMRKDEQYKTAIDFSLGDVVLASEGPDPVPAFVNPAGRSSYSLLTMTGLQETRFDTTTLTKDQYDAITRADAQPIRSLADPQNDAVVLKKDRVYIFKTANGKKGLIYVSALDPKTGTIEQTDGSWVPGTRYYEAAITTKTILP